MHPLATSPSPPTTPPNGASGGRTQRWGPLLLHSSVVPASTWTAATHAACTCGNPRARPWRWQSWLRHRERPLTGAPARAAAGCGAGAVHGQGQRALPHRHLPRHAAWIRWAGQPQPSCTPRAGRLPGACAAAPCTLPHHPDRPPNPVRAPPDPTRRRALAAAACAACRWQVDHDAQHQCHRVPQL